LDCTKLVYFSPGLDDYYFHGLERSRINTHFGQAGLSSTILDDKANEQVESYSTEQLFKIVQRIK
jgi:hypothetical protein